MSMRTLEQRERLLSIWAQDRLEERDTIEWAIGALKQSRGSMGESTVALFEALYAYAEKNDMLPSAFLKVWRLFRIIARENANNFPLRYDLDLKRRIADGKAGPEDIDQIVDQLRPRLRAEKLSSWAAAEERPADEPMRWVNWDFKISLNSSYLPSARFSPAQMSTLSSTLLHRLIEQGTARLIESLKLAEEVGWMADGRDLPNAFIHSVSAPQRSTSQRNAEDEDDEDGNDPDSYNTSFAPIVKVLSGALSELAKKDSPLAAELAERWRAGPGGIFLRLFAFAAWNKHIVSTNVAVEFLAELDDHPFWRWFAFPEVASVRALRWDDFPESSKAALESRLLNGPPDRAFRSDEPVTQKTKDFHRDHELARLVDNCLSVSAKMRQAVDTRRRVDSTFPSLIPRLEPGLPGPRFVLALPGNPEALSAVPMADLLATLHASNQDKLFEKGNDAEAFARTINGKIRILEGLSNSNDRPEVVEGAWRLLLSYPYEKTEEPCVARKLAEDTAQLALNLERSSFERIADQLSYWLDGTDENYPDFVGAESLWLMLLPHAANSANEVATQPEVENDLTLAALNEPLGHLLSLFMRRCPSMPRAEDKRPPLPAKFVLPLKGLNDRAEELLANRLAIQMRYFVIADKKWLDDAVISVMLQKGPASNRLWEAFAKYGGAPPHQLWPQLQRVVFQKLFSADISPEAKRQLAEMSVIVWIWSKEDSGAFELDPAKLRTALGLTNEEVRAAAAWKFSTVFRASNDPRGNYSPERLWTRLGPAFFKEVWPLEPALQSPLTAKDFANIPAYVGEEHFGDVVKLLLPYLVPFEVWSVQTGFHLEPNTSATQAIVTKFPEEVLILLAVSIDDTQGHRVYELKNILDQIASAQPSLKTDHRMRTLRKLEGTV